MTVERVLGGPLAQSIFRGLMVMVIVVALGAAIGGAIRLIRLICRHLRDTPVDLP